MKKSLFTRYSLVLLIAVFFTACTSTSRLAGPQNTGSTAEAVMQAEREFSKMSQEKGMNTAFIAYAADNGVLLRPQNMPIVGRDNIRMHMARTSDKDIRLTWSPAYADIAASGELAYTYGTYLLETLDMAGKPVTTEGTYVSIWKKDASGYWKFVLDTGNPGLRP